MSAKPTPGPVTLYTKDSPRRPYILCHLRDVLAPYPGATLTFGQENPKAGSYWPAVGLGGVSEETIMANGRLIEATFNAASAAAELGYNPVEAVRALPRLLGELTRTGDLHHYLPYDVAENIANALAAARGNP